jgi:translocation and assembly module TamB
LTTTASFGGRFGAPEVTGVLEGRGLGVRNLLAGVAVRDGEVRIRLAGDTARIERFVVRAGDGQLTVAGDASIGSAPQARLALRAERFQLLGRVDRRLVTSGRADLTLQPKRVAVDGQFVVDEGLFDASRSDAPSLDADVVIRSDDALQPDAAVRRAPPPERQVDVAVQVDLGEQLRVRGRGLDTLLAGRLRVTAPAGRLAVAGTVRTVGGSYAAYGQKLTIERGRISFSGPVDNPRLDVLALRPNLDVEVGVSITGTAQAPRVRLHTVPDMSDSHKLSWLVLGRDPGGLDRADTALVQRAAFALLAGENASPDDSLIRRFGLDTFSLRESDGEVRETIVSVGKQLSSRWYVGYERGVNATVGTWQLIYRVAQRLTLRLQAGTDAAFDAIWTWRVP